MTPDRAGKQRKYRTPFCESGASVLRIRIHDHHKKNQREILSQKTPAAEAFSTSQTR
jgi:hypothetical protein